MLPQSAEAFSVWDCFTAHVACSLPESYMGILVGEPGL